MTFGEFKVGVKRLQDVYDARYFPSERVELIFRAVNFLPVKVWDAAVTEIIGECIHAPPVSRVKELVNVVRKRMGYIDETRPYIPEHSNISGEERRAKVIEIRSLIARAGNLGQTNRERGDA